MSNNDLDPQAAADFAAFLRVRGAAPEQSEVPDPPGPRAPRPDPSQGMGTTAPAVGERQLLAELLTIPPSRGDGGWVAFA